MRRQAVLSIRRNHQGIMPDSAKLTLVKVYEAFTQSNVGNAMGYSPIFKKDSQWDLTNKLSYRSVNSSRQHLRSDLLMMDLAHKATTSWKARTSKPGDDCGFIRTY
jgi:hypothetical protein